MEINIEKIILSLDLFEQMFYNLLKRLDYITGVNSMDETKEKYRKRVIEMIMEIEDIEILIKIYTLIKHS